MHQYCILCGWMKGTSRATFLVQHGFVLQMKNIIMLVIACIDSMCNKALGVGYRGTIQHSALPCAV